MSVHIRKGPAIIMFAVSIAVLAQSNGGPVQDAKAEDSYAVYSLAVKNAVTPSGNTQILILAKMAIPFGDPKNACSPVFIGANPWEESWSELLSDWKDRRDSTPADLQRSFNLDKPYLLLSEREGEDFSSMLSSNIIPPDRQKPAGDPRFAGATSMLGLSNVFFNRNRTLALVFVSVSCGPLCGNYGWKVFEKISSGWRNAFPCSGTAA